MAKYWLLDIKIKELKITLNNLKKVPLPIEGTQMKDKFTWVRNKVTREGV